MFPDFLDMKVDEMHIEMATVAFTDLEVIEQIVKTPSIDAAIGIIDVKSYYIESPEEVAALVKRCLEHAPADRLVFAPDCGLSQTARWAAKDKRKHMCDGVALVKKELGIS